MTPEQIKLITDSWQKVETISENAAELFYNKLFELDPTAKKLFKGDMKEQGRKLMSMIGMAVNGLNKLDDIVPTLKALGQRHVDYGVKKEDYDTVGAALLWTLAQGLGDDFTPEMEAAWTAVYNTLAETMTTP